MALKMTITKEVFDKLPADVQKEYKVSADGYVLDVEGYTEPAELKRAKDREKDRADEAERKLADVQKEYDKLKGDDVKKSGDIDALDRRWQAKHDKEVERLTGVITKMRGKSAEDTLTSTVDGIAAKLAPKHAKLLGPHIRSSLKAETDDDGNVKLTMSKDGKWVDYDAAALEKSFRDNKDFAGIVQASGASGGGAPAPQPGNNGGAGNPPNFTVPAPGGQQTGGVDFMKGDPAAIIAARQAAKEAAGAQ